MTADKTRPRHALQTYKYMLGALSGLVGALSVVSITVKIWKVGLSPVLVELLAFYTRIVRATTDPIISILPFNTSDWYRDAYVISFILVTLWVRSLLIARPPPMEAPRGALPILILATAALLSVPLFGFVTLAILLPTAKITRIPEVRSIYWVTLLAASLAVLIFFVLNSQL